MEYLKEQQAGSRKLKNPGKKRPRQKNLVKDLLELGFQLCIEVVDETEDGGIIVLTELAS